jgi:hypothetical protein
MVKRSLEESFNLERIVPFNELKNHSFVFLVADDNQNRVFSNEDILNFGKLLTVGNVNVLGVVNVDSVLIRALLGVVLSFLETYYN